MATCEIPIHSTTLGGFIECCSSSRLENSFLCSLNGSSKGLPSIKNILIKDAVFDSDLFSNFRQSLFFAFKVKIPISRGICELGFSSRPSAVFWRVWSIVVDSIYRMAIGSRTHVFSEGFKALPALTESDSPASVVFKNSRFWIAASRPHREPCSISSGFRHPMFDRSDLKATAASRPIGHHVALNHESFHPAFASTIYKLFVANFLSWSNYRPQVLFHDGLNTWLHAIM